jgi:hypothetical protein
MSEIRYRAKAYGPLLKITAWWAGDILGVPSAEEIMDAALSDGVVSTSDKALVDNGFDVCCEAIARAADGKWFSCSSGSCTYHDDYKVVIVIRGGATAYGVKPWSERSVHAENESFTLRHLADIAKVAEKDDLAYLEALYSRAHREEIQDLIRVTSELRACFGALPPGFAWVMGNLWKWRKPRREAARLRKRREAAAREARAWAEMSARGNSRRVDRRLGDLSEWEEFVRPHRWTF